MNYHDYVKRNPIVKKTDRFTILIKIFVFPAIMSFFFAISLDTNTLLNNLIYGLTFGYSLQSILIYSFNAVRALVTGDDRGI